MAAAKNYRVNCVERKACPKGSSRFHITRVGTNRDTRATSGDAKTVAQVRADIAAGHLVVTIGSESGKLARVEPYDCPSCDFKGITTEPDDTTDNNLDTGLNTCTFK